MKTSIPSQATSDLWGTLRFPIPLSLEVDVNLLFHRDIRFHE